MRKPDGSIDWVAILAIAGILYFMVFNGGSQAAIMSQVRGVSSDVSGTGDKLDIIAKLVGGLSDGMQGLNAGMSELQNLYGDLSGQVGSINTRLSNVEERQGRIESWVQGVVGGPGQIVQPQAGQSQGFSYNVPTATPYAVMEIK